MFGNGMEVFVTESDDVIGPFKKWFESKDIKVLVLHLDEGSQAYSATWFIAYRLGLCFVCMRDIYHREWNDVKLALSDSNLWWVVILTTVALNMPHGPWEGASFHDKMKEMAGIDLKEQAAQSPLFRSLLFMICNDMGILYDGTASQADMISRILQD